jgi:carbon-monoxide dehydrogenase large subunit
MMADKATSARIGQPVRRREDLRLVTGKGSYADDVNLPDQAYAVMVRSPHAHARICAIDANAAMAAPGVLAVCRDLIADCLKPIPHKVWSQHPAEIALKDREGFKTFTAPHYPLPSDKVRFVGEAVAMVVARSVAAAKDGAELVAVDYEVLPAVTDTREAANPDAPRLFDEAASNVVVDGELGDAAATAAAFTRAAHVVKFDTWVQRITGVPMEPRAAVAAFDPATGRTTLYAGSGGVWRLKDDLATILAVPPDEVRVIMREVGGNFGTRGMIYAEFALVAWASRRLRQPVKWTGDRHEAFLCDYQARDLAVTAELALDARGNFLAMRGSNISNAGAHTTNYSPLQKGVEIMTTIYRVPVAHFRARAVVSNTSVHPPLSQRRPPRSHVCDGAPDRPRLPRARLRPRRDQAPQSRCPIRISLQERIRHDLRQRRLPPHHGVGAAHGRLGRLCGPARRRPRPRQAARHRCRQLPRHRRRGRPRAHRDDRPSRRLGGRGDRHQLSGARPRDELRPIGE